MGNYHVPFWRAAERATTLLTLIFFKLALGSLREILNSNKLSFRYTEMNPDASPS